MKSYCHIFAVAAVSLASASFSLSAIAQTVIPQPPEVAAKGHILIDFDTGKVLSEQNADMSLAPASLTKMMTSYVVGTELKNGNITNEDMVTISENAWAKNFPGSSLMFIEVGTQVSVADLNKGIIIQSGNDACVALAEHNERSCPAFGHDQQPFWQQPWPAKRRELLYPARHGQIIGRINPRRAG
jgi:D-alanyl-D-alanine carboxypeptidase (penicillin-binding protein 5/6)